MAVIQFLEFLISVITFDNGVGVHFIITIIMFNYVPTRLWTKVPVTLFNYFIFLAAKYSFFLTQREDELFVKKNTEILQPWFVTVGYSITFVFIEIYATKVREGFQVENHLAIQFGEVQSSLLSKRKNLNEMLLNSMLPEEITKQMNYSQNDDESPTNQLVFVESFPDVTVLFCMIGE